MDLALYARRAWVIFDHPFNDYERARTGPFGCLGTRRFASSVHGGGMDPLGGAGEDMVTAPGRKPVVLEDPALVVLRPARSRGAWWAC